MTRAVGRNVLRKEGVEKVTGAARYIDDLTFPNLLHARTVRSTIPSGEILDIRYGFDTRAFTIVTHRDIPGRNVVALIDNDQPALAERQVRHVAEPIVLLAHEDRDALLAADVGVIYRETTPNYDAEASAVVFKTIAIEKGDIGQGFAAAAVVVDGEYRMGHQEQLYIETNGVIAVPGPNGEITVYGSMQCPYYVHRALKVLLGLPDEKVRVIQTETGGGFGGKEEYPSMIAGHAALVALNSGRPVKLIYDRVEDMVATTKRHPAIVRHRTGLARDGRMTAMDIEVILDGGAYATLSAVVLSRGVIHASGPYRCDHVRIRGRAAMTNTPPNGAFRGFGAPQTQFAVEVHMDRIAERMGIDPVRLREINALRPGDVTATGQRLGRDTSARQVLREAVERTGFDRRRKAIARENARGKDGAALRGIGLSLFFHGSGFTGGGEVKLASKASLALTDHGTVRILVASTEIGQGTRTMHAQIVADTLGIPYDAVEVNAADTAVVPDSGPTVASRTCMIVGRILQRCAEEMRARLGKLTPQQYARKHGPMVVTRQYERPADMAWDDASYRGDAYGTYGWACDVVELEVDRDTWEVKPIAFTTVHEIGKAIHPMLAVGQIEGGSAQGLGYALLEDVVMRDGRMANASLTNYIIPTTLDTPAMEVVVLENPYEHGPFGAKGVGEMPIDGPAPAVINALRHAGFDLRQIPATPERIMVSSAEPTQRTPRTRRKGPVRF
ncbi:MAG TPA: xanthine dehydrogenase family protein molybdopterin-binding subunit [Vicinamibacterales bacterium]|jgi:CO/xanthine dehydrogenase Mo-binding subunit|nr:xanthine dehydrogenase family protein molybdopterin-binding subunit [Vicinamibacterales bacterium]